MQLGPSNLGLVFEPHHTHRTVTLVEMLRGGMDNLPAANNRAVGERREGRERSGGGEGGRHGDMEETG